MAQVFFLPHEPLTPNGWLRYSHASQPPTDRQVVHGNAIVRPAGIGSVANWYFLSDEALEILGGANYHLVCGHWGEWVLRIEENDRAALFKLRFM